MTSASFHHQGTTDTEVTNILSQTKSSVRFVIFVTS